MCIYGVGLFTDVFIDFQSSLTRVVSLIHWFIHSFFYRQSLSGTQADLKLTKQLMLALDSLLSFYLSLLSTGITGVSYSAWLCHMQKRPCSSGIHWQMLGVWQAVQLYSYSTSIGKLGLEKPCDYLKFAVVKYAKEVATEPWWLHPQSQHPLS